MEIYDIENHVIFTLITFAMIVLATLLIDYMRTESGLRKGSVLLSIVALTIIALPIAKNLSFKASGVEFSLETAKRIEITKDDLEVQAFKIEGLAASLEEQSNELGSMKAQFKEEIETNKQLLSELSSQPNNNNNAEIKKLIAKSEATLSVLSAEPTEWEVGFESIKFDHICERLNSTGEFYFSFLVNGKSIIDVGLDQRIKVREGDIYSLRDYSKTKVSFLPSQENRVSISGFVKEYDGRTGFGLGRSIKVNTVGLIKSELSLDDQSFTLHIPNEDNSKCKVTLNLSAERLN